MMQNSQVVLVTQSYALINNSQLKSPRGVVRLIGIGAEREKGSALIEAHAKLHDFTTEHYLAKCLKTRKARETERKKKI